jgi:hypothetical protein
MRQNRIKLDLLPILVMVAFLIFLLIQALAFGRDFSEVSKNRQFREAVGRGIIILAEFPDVRHDLDRNLVQMRFSKQLNSYVKEMSYNKVFLRIDLTKRWYTMPDSVSKYRISSRNLEVDKSRVKKLIDDALAAAEDEVDFSKYSFAAIFMSAKLTDYGMIGLCGCPGMLGWSEEAGLKTRRGQPVKGGWRSLVFRHILEPSSMILHIFLEG